MFKSFGNHPCLLFKIFGISLKSDKRLWLLILLYNLDKLNCGDVWGYVVRWFKASAKVGYIARTDDLLQAAGRGPDSNPHRADLL